MAKVIDSGSEVILHFTIKLADDSVADSTRASNKPARLKMGDGSLSPGFEQRLLGLAAGEQAAFTLAPDEAFGHPNPDAILHMERTRFPADVPVEVGAIIAFGQPDGREIPGIVRAVEGESVTVDFNHPLAGQTVLFEVEIVDVDPAQ